MRRPLPPDEPKTSRVGMGALATTILVSGIVALLVGRQPTEPVDRYAVACVDVDGTPFTEVWEPGGSLVLRKGDVCDMGDLPTSEINVVVEGQGEPE